MVKMKNYMGLVLRTQWQDGAWILDVGLLAIVFFCKHNRLDYGPRKYEY